MQQECPIRLGCLKVGLKPEGDPPSIWSQGVLCFEPHWAIKWGFWEKHYYVSGEFLVKAVNLFKKQHSISWIICRQGDGDENLKMNVECARPPGSC